MSLAAILIPVLAFVALAVFFKKRIKQQKQMRHDMSVARQNSNMEYLRSIGYTK